MVDRRQPTIDACGRSGVVGRHDPAIAAHARFAAIETAVDENSCEPHFERPRFAVRRDVAEHLDERVLDGFVGFGGVAEVLERDAQRAALMGHDEAFETFPSLIHCAAFDEFANVDRQT